MSTENQAQQQPTPEAMPAEKPSSNNKKILLIALIIIVLCVIVGICIVVVLSLSATEGIKVVQNNSRDTARRAAIQDVNAGIADYFSMTGVFPDTLRFSENDLTLSGGDTDFPVMLDDKFIYPDETGVLTGTNTTVGNTTIESTQWCFIGGLEDGYALGVYLENGEWSNQGTSSSVSCDDSVN